MIGTFVLVLTATLGPGAEAREPGDLVNLPFLLSFVSGNGADTGGYDFGDESLSFLRLPVSHEALAASETRRFGVRLRFETAFGVYDFGDLVANPDLDQVKAVTILPGFGVPIRLRHDLELFPYVDLGTAHVTDGGQWTFLARLGLALEFERFWREVRLLARPSVEYTWSRADGTALDDDLGSVGVKLGARHALPLAPRGHTLDMGLFSELEYLFVPAELARDDVGGQFEVGLSLGTVEPVRFWRLPLPRLSGGYRFGDGVSGLRLRIGGRF